MPQALMTIEQYIVEVRKKDTLFMGFSPTYAKAWMRLPMSEDEEFNWLSKDNVNWGKRDEFLQFMSHQLPDIQLTDVFDNVPLEYQLWPFLGTIAMDIDVGSEEEKILTEHYEGEDGHPKSLDAVIFIMTLEQASTAHEKRKQLDDMDDD